MAKRILSIRAEKDDVARWAELANAADLSLGDWIGRQCNRALSTAGIRYAEPQIPETPLEEVAESSEARRSKRPKEKRESVQVPIRAGSGMMDVHMDRVDLSKMCIHRKGFGQPCYKCDPKRGVPNVL